MIEGFFIGLIAGAVLAVILLSRAIEKILKPTDLEKMAAKIDEQRSSKISARVEEVNGVFYVYNADDDSFLVQGSTLNELVEHIDKRIPDATIVITEGEPDTVARFKSILKSKSLNGNETAT